MTPPGPELPGFDPLVDEQVADPGPWLARARKEAPVFYMPKYREWVITRYRDCAWVLRDTETFSSRDVITVPDPPPELANRFPLGLALKTNVGGLDPPEHSRLRQLIQPAFSARQAARYEDATRDIAKAAIDEFIGSKKVDLVPAYCHKVPISVIAVILGIPAGDVPMLHRWMLDLVLLFGNPRLNHTELVELMTGQAAFEDYVRALIHERRTSLNGSEDFLASLLKASSTEGAPGLTDEEILGTVVGIVFAAGDTTATAIGHTVHCLLEDRALWERVLADRALVEAAVEEALRLRDPNRAARRTTTRDCTVGEVGIRASSPVYVHLWSAGHDEAVFENPELFDLDRPNARQHLSFGHGPHVCPGAPLARLEIKVALECLLDRLPSLRLGREANLRYARSRAIPSLLGGLFVEWD
jgi:cytochrome P450